LNFLQGFIEKHACLEFGQASYFYKCVLMDIFRMIRYPNFQVVGRQHRRRRVAAWLLALA
jgi:hypothetical protein